MAASSEPIAGDGVADRQREEAKAKGQHDEVQHRMLLPIGEMGGLAPQAMHDFCERDCGQHVPLVAFVFEAELGSTL